MLVARIIEGHSREHRKGHGDETAHAARDGEHDKDDAVVVLRHEGTSMRRCRARSSARLRAKRAAKRGPTRKQFSPFLQRLTLRGWLERRIASLFSLFSFAIFLDSTKRIFQIQAYPWSWRTDF